MNKAIVILALTSVALAGASASLYRELHAEREHVQVLEHEVQSLRTQPQAAHVTATPFSSVPAPSSKQATVSKPELVRQTPDRLAQLASLATPTPTPPEHAKLRERFSRQQQALMNDPEYRTALRKQQRLTLARQYPDLMEDLEISQDQADQLLDLLTDQQIEAMQEANRVDPEALQSDPNAMAQYRQKMMERSRAHQAAIAQALGQGGMQRWQDYQSTMGSRFRTRQLSQALETAGIPLREDQQRSVRRALAQHEKQMQQEAQDFAARLPSREEMSAADRLKLQEDQLERMQSYYERARDSVAGILSAEQLEQYKSIHDQELAMSRAALRVQRAQLEANGGENELSASGFRPVPGAMMGTAVPVMVSDE